MKKASLKINLLFVCLALVSASCTKSKSPQKAIELPGEVNPSCGAIDMSPPSNVYPNDPVNFEIIPPSGITLTNIQWNILKGATNILSTATATVTHTFSGANEGAGSYVAKATFRKSDGNDCALEKAFQILAHDVCVRPTGISGPTIGYVNEETSPFSVNAEPCFQGQVLWDMNNDGNVEYTLAPDAFTPHTYNQTGSYVVSAQVIDFEDDNQMAPLLHTIEIRNKSCLNPFTNAVVAHGETVEFARRSEQCGGIACDKIPRACNNGQFETGGNTGLYTENPATCPVSPACPATYAWEASQFGQCTGACESSVGTRPITDYICKKTQDGSTSTAPDAECASNIGAKPTGQTQACVVPPENQTVNCLSCGSVPHGGSVTHWAENPKCGQTCNSQSRICNNGTLPAFDPNYTYPSEKLCPIAECPPEYTYTWTVGEYGKCSALACGTEGTQTRSVTCTRNDGVPVADSFCRTKKPGTTQACSAQPCVDCSLNGVTVLHGQSRNFYNTSNVSCPQTCSANSRTCNNGVLSGSAAYDKPTCTAAACTYTWTIGDFGSCSATACGTQGVQTRSVICTRSDGVVSPDSSCTTPKPATTQACSARPCYSCNLPWGGTVAHLGNATAYNASTVQCGQTCQSESRSCNDGILSGTFANQSCSVEDCTSPIKKGSSCHAFMGTMITWTDSSTGKTCIGNLFGNLMVEDYLQIGGTQYDSPNTVPWDQATRRGSAKVICDSTPDQFGMLPFKVESGTCKDGEPNLIKAPLLNQDAPNDCKASPVVQQPFGTGTCAVYRQGTFGDMPLKGTFLHSGVKKYATMGEFTNGYEHMFTHGKGKIFASSAMKITYNGETKDLSTACGNMDAEAPKNSTCTERASATIGGVTFTMGVGAKNTIDPRGYIPEYIGSFKNTQNTQVWTQKTCGVVTVSTSLGYLPPPCP